MRSRNFMILITIFFITTATVFGQTSWLDRPLNRNWNSGDGVVPTPPLTTVPMDPRCRDQARTPDSLADRALTRAGWMLFGPSQNFGATTVVMAMAGADGQCRPDQYNAFVFVSNRFAGTLALRPMTSRTDGALNESYLSSATKISAEFVRYSSTDAMCCPSQTSSVFYSISSEARPVVNADTINTTQTCANSGSQTPETAVTGTVTYRQRVALSPTAVVSVKLLDVSRQDVAANVISEDRIPAEGKQVPFPFSLTYDPTKIQERNRYTVRAEISDGERLLFTTDTSYPVITQGNPTSGVEIVVVPVAGGGGGQRENSVRGTVTYLQRMALAPNSQITVRLVDSADPNGTPVSQNTFSSGNRQVPIPYELEYAMRDINRQRNYEMRAEIRSGGQLRFKSAAGVPVTLRGNQTGDVEIVVVPATEGPEPVTGREFNLSKLGAGSMQIEGRGTQFLIRGSVVVRQNADADVTLSRLDGSTVFSGKLIFLDSNTMRIMVQNSGSANASGEIEVRYNGRSLTSITSRNLELDGQNVTIRF